MALTISEPDVLAKFDRLVQKGELSYSPPKRQYLTDGPIQFQISISSALTRKPLYSTPPSAPTSGTSTPTPKPTTATLQNTNYTTTINPPTSASQSPPLLFADPDPDFHIAALPPTHTLILNKYCVLRPQYILHSTTPQKQSDYLGLQDWEAAWRALGAIEEGGEGKDGRRGRGRAVVTYNCGEAAGASRSHKHLQILPYSGCIGDGDGDGGGFRMFPDALGDQDAKARLPFVYSVSRDLPDADDSKAPAELKNVYDGLVEEAVRETGFEGSEMAHNMIMVREWMLLVPRLKARVGKCVTGATGVVGMVWVGNEEEAGAWREGGVLRMLGEMGMKKVAR